MRILERLPHEPGRDYALRTIKENIISLDLEPGSQISKLECAVIELACEMAKPEDVVKLENNVKLQSFYLEIMYQQARGHGQFSAHALPQ